MSRSHTCRECGGRTKEYDDMYCPTCEAVVIKGELLKEEKVLERTIWVTEREQCLLDVLHIIDEFRCSLEKTTRSFPADSEPRERALSNQSHVEAVALRIQDLLPLRLRRFKTSVKGGT